MAAIKLMCKPVVGRLIWATIERSEIFCSQVWVSADVQVAIKSAAAGLFASLHPTQAVHAFDGLSTDFQALWQQNLWASRNPSARL